MKIILALVALALTGCAGLQEQQQAYNASLTPEQRFYRYGQEHGCDSGSKASGNWTKTFTKDVGLYINNAYYKSGWDDGFTECKGTGDTINRAIDQSL